MLKKITGLQVIMEAYVSRKKYIANENSNVRKTKQNRLMQLPNCALCGKKNWHLLKIKNPTILMANLKWIKSLTNFYWLETNLCQNCI